MSAVAQVRDEKQSVGFKQVLIATDFSPASERALAYGLAIARRYGSALSVVHAIPPEQGEPIPLDPLPRELDRRQLEAEERMKHLGQKAQINDIEYHLLLDQGPVWDVLSSVIEHQHIDLLVVGTRGRGGLKKMALGSVAEEGAFGHVPSSNRWSECLPRRIEAGRVQADPFRNRFRARFRQSLPVCSVPGRRLSGEACTSAHDATDAVS